MEALTRDALLADAKRLRVDREIPRLRQLATEVPVVWIENTNMPPTTIENPILNSPYCEPTRHFRFDADNQITGDIDAGRRGSSYFLPIAAPKKKSAPGLFDDIEEQ
jgi:hypothetical protein